jgi:hypothetical protein
MIYDFDGLDLNQTDLPEGDYKNFDMNYQISSNPLAQSDVLGDRVLKLELNWSSGTGEFGKGISKYVELNNSTDRISFYFFNPTTNYADALIDIAIKEDDNQNNIYDSGSDDKWIKTVSVPRSGSWQLISIPLNSFSDAGAAGNGIFDAGYTNNNGRIFTISFTFNRSAIATSAESYYIDMICFSDGPLDHGNSITDLPAKDSGDKCLLGSLSYRTPADSVPVEVEALLTGGNKLKYINIFMPYAYSGTTASALPGSSVQRLMDNGYRPIITWEMKYSGYPTLDPVQPRLNLITNGYFDSYLDAFANKVKSYSDTIIIRLFHEFDGNWYSWSIHENGQDPANLIAAYRHIVDRFNAQGATNVLWMWSPNSAPSPNAAYNWFVHAYPGDAYVDLISTSIYNHPNAGIPPWRSLRALLTESYYYAKKYFPTKQFLIAELACRERYSAEVSSSQTKAEWLCQASLDVQSYFSKTRGLIFFNTNKEHDWRINSSVDALNAVKNCFWFEPHFNYLVTDVENMMRNSEISFYPNPFINEGNLIIDEATATEILNIEIHDITGRCVSKLNADNISRFGTELLPGIYFLSVNSKNNRITIRIIKN